MTRPLAMAVVWGVFAVPDDPSRSGGAPIPIPGILRLVLELGLFVSAGFCLRIVGLERWGTGLAVVVILHYAVSYDRVAWLLGQ